MWILPISLEDFAHKENSPMQQGQMIGVLRLNCSVSETEQKKCGSIPESPWLAIWLLLSNSRIIPFCEKFWNNTYLRNISPTDE